MTRRATISHSAGVAVVVLLIAVVLALGGCSTEPVLSPGDESFDPIAPSSPAEVVARTLRLAGLEELTVGEEGRTAIARMRLPAVNSAADIELAWQAGIASLAVAYPEAREYVVQIDSVEELLEVRVAGKAARDSVENDDADALKDEVAFVLLADAGAATAAPEQSYVVDSDEVGGYLDAKNQAAELYGTSCSITYDVETARTAVPGVPAVPADAAAAATWATRAAEALSTTQIEGAEELTQRLVAFGSGAEPADVEAARAWYHTVAAVTADASFGSVLQDVATHAELAANSQLASGAEADAVLVAAQSPDAPAAAADATGFTVVDEGGETTSTPLPESVLDAYGTDGTFRYLGADGPVTVDAETWVRVEREDGTVYWLAGDDAAVALTDGSIEGWAFSRKQAVLVDATDVGTWLEVYPLP